MVKATIGVCGVSGIYSRALSFASYRPETILHKIPGDLLRDGGFKRILTFQHPDAEDKLTGHAYNLLRMTGQLASAQCSHNS